jgi:hypothetical protein
MGAKTGRPRGRPKGSKSRRTIVREAAMADAAKRAERTISEPFAGDAYELLVHIYKDPGRQLALRLDAAKTAIRYERPALAPKDFEAEPSQRQEEIFITAGMTQQELADLYDRMIRQPTSLPNCGY